MIIPDSLLPNVRGRISKIDFAIPYQQRGTQLWAELHSSTNATPEWFADWLSRVPNYGCGCRRNFQEILEHYPVRYDDFFAWSVEAHNAVNRKLSKQEVSLDEATAIWRKQTE